MTLDRVKRGQSFKITSIPNEVVRVQAIRFGIAEGETVSCEEVVPAGPIVIRKNKQQIALGRGLARQIGVVMSCTEKE
ncbi:MAG: FeoA domain protein [Pelotomaculum sp. PtaB.Bin013]|uniref:Ferrous iron transport protein A n=1 Tax=Pelotomaculum isophthalicicum JI TaxID=947010 RepID=A0A9X4GYB9_9FIRM|nr:ferrous iron transport protein A [Pelotomaculum isophthalicicum]MDF9407655.1 ferrous iron transport protein A [Pelotomaculum isophthalicicum JI]OPX83723.1 MAG: FeoA domain protein [Pelotomaculum sp. PtaB.Bin013]